MAVQIDGSSRALNYDQLIDVNASNSGGFATKESSCLVKSDHHVGCLQPDAMTYKKSGSGNNPPAALSGKLENIHSGPNDLYKSSKILQAVMLAGELDTPPFERILATHEAHGKRWNYETCVLRRFILGDGDWHDSIFSKPLFVLQLLTGELAKVKGERAEWIVWFDSDTIILNPNVSWELFLPPSDFQDVHMISTRDWNGLNCGIFFVRVNEWSVNFFTEVIALPRMKPDLELGFSRDQMAMEITLQKPEFEQHFLYQPINWFNRFHNGRGHLSKIVPGELLVHFAGSKADGRKVLDAAVDMWLNRIDYEPSVWAVPLQNTSYPVDIERFWSALRQARQALKEGSAAVEEYNGTIRALSSSTQTAISELKSSCSSLRTVLVKEPFRPGVVETALLEVREALDMLYTKRQSEIAKPTTAASEIQYNIKSTSITSDSR